MIEESARDEFAALSEVADELGLDHGVIPKVRRESVAVGPDQDVSVLVWGEASPELVFLHGGGQNARTWDLVALRLGRPAIAIDLPGHGHSAWRDDRDYGPLRSAPAIATVVERLAPDADAVVGMSLGGMTTIRLAATRPDLVRRAVLVDVTPGSAQAHRTMTTEQRGTTALTGGPRIFADREEMVAAAVAASPRRPAAAVRRGVVHNTKQLPDGTWTWRYDLSGGRWTDHHHQLWADVEALTMPTMLVKGGASVFVADDDLAEMRRRRPTLRVEVVADSGHSVQSDQPDVLSGLIEDFVPGR